MYSEARPGLAIVGAASGVDLRIIRGREGGGGGLGRNSSRGGGGKASRWEFRPLGV